MSHQPIFFTSILSASIALIGCDAKTGAPLQQTSAASEVASAVQSSAAEKNSPAVFFDDFNYQSMEAFNRNGWRVRTETGHPGIKSATWSAEGISFHQDIPAAHAGAVRMSSVTAGQGENTRHTQFCHARKYREGTYAARVFFRDEPSYGPDGDEVIQTFYTISPLKAPMDKDYSEADFEYQQDIDWVFFQEGVVLNPEELIAQVSHLQTTGVNYIDDVQEQNPPLSSPCGL